MLVALVAGVLDYGFLFNQQQSVASAAREGARTGAATDMGLDPVGAARDKVVATLVANGLDAEAATIDVQLTDVHEVLIAVTLDVPVSPLLGLVPVPESLTSHVTMRLEDQVPDTGDTGH